MIEEKLLIEFFVGKYKQCENTVVHYQFKLYQLFQSIMGYDRKPQAEKKGAKKEEPTPVKGKKVVAKPAAGEKKK